jgi:hypothetical protein
LELYDHVLRKRRIDLMSVKRAPLWKVRKQIDDFIADAKTDLSVSRNATTVTVQNDQGTDAPIPGADATTAGILTAAEFSRLQGIPSGGTAGQVLEKVDSTNYNTQWADASGGICIINGGKAASNYCEVLSIVSISPTSGDTAGGTSVTITGENFDTGAASTTVTFGGSSATSVTVVNSTTITCDTPSGTAGDVDVVVDQDGNTATLTDGFEYTVPTTTQVEFTTVGSGSWTVPAGVTSVDVILVAGGGGGGSNRGGGGGGGGVLQTTNHSVTPGANISYTVGAGGAGGPGGASTSAWDNGDNGEDTSFDTLTATGGGGGAEPGSVADSNADGLDGGSGGGAGHANGAWTGGAGTAGQGNAGGDTSSSATSGAGGGGAGAAGQDEQGNDGGAGGAGIDLSATVGTSVGDSGVFGGGGGGGGWNNLGGAGGSGGGGDGGSESGSISAQNGAANTGGGGGGGTNHDRAGGDGGSGIIILRYTA